MPRDVVEGLDEILLMGPGPSPVHPSVRRAMAAPTIGHLDPRFLAVMDETAAMLRQVFGAQGRLTLPISGTGTAGMEAAVLNLLEPGDAAVVVVAGYFGQRLAEAAQRAGAHVLRVEVPWGRACEPDELQAALSSAPPVKVVALVHAETSTGVLQPVGPLAEVARRHGALVLVDAVTSLGGVPVEMDRSGIDACYSCSQKCLGCPPGLAPLSVSDGAMRRVRERRKPPPSFYLDLQRLEGYWGTERLYHHTAPINMVFALRQALRLALEEGLTPRYERHRVAAQALWAGLEELGLRLVVEDPGIRAPTLTTVYVPEGVDEAAVRRRLLLEFGIEIGGGLGPWAGRVWRIGTMGESARLRHVITLLGALGAVLAGQGRRASGAAAVEAALAAAGRAGRGEGHGGGAAVSSR